MADNTISQADSTTDVGTSTGWTLSIDSVHYLETICERMREILRDNPGMIIQMNLHYDWSQVRMQGDDNNGQHSPQYSPMSPIYPYSESDVDEDVGDEANEDVGANVDDEAEEE